MYKSLLLVVRVHTHKNISRRKTYKLINYILSHFSFYPPKPCRQSKDGAKKNYSVYAIYAFIFLTCKHGSASWIFMALKLFRSKEPKKFIVNNPPLSRAHTCCKYHSSGSIALIRNNSETWLVTHFYTVSKISILVHRCCCRYSFLLLGPEGTFWLQNL